MAWAKGGHQYHLCHLLEVFVECLASGMLNNHPARVGKCKQETLGASMVTQGATKCSLMERIQHQ
jgi:hypothetical protein